MLGSFIRFVCKTCLVGLFIRFVNCVCLLGFLLSSFVRLVLQVVAFSGLSPKSPCSNANTIIYFRLTKPPLPQKITKVTTSVGSKGHIIVRCDASVKIYTKSNVHNRS